MTRPIALLVLLTLLPAPAAAFCGFFVSGADARLYNDATQVALMRRGNRTVMSMSNTYNGPPEDFAMVVPVPVVLQEKQIRTLPHDVFDRVDRLSAPRLVEYWEQDPCGPAGGIDSMLMAMDGGGLGSRRATARLAAGRRVTVEAEFAVGEYQIVILSAEEAHGLDAWLRENGYRIPAGAPEALAPYIAEGMKFFVAKVDIEKVERDAAGRVTLSPLRFDFEADRLRLPVRLGLLNAEGAQDLVIYVLSPWQRFEVANYDTVFIPSNLEVDDAASSRFGAFYAALFDETLALAGGRAVVTEYVWQTTSCDPCPAPPLRPRDIMSLGGDVLGVGGGRGKGGDFSSWVLTRLHTRYSRETLAEDLVFAPAGPVRGGRGRYGRDLEPPGEVEDARSNSFQARYIIRHRWDGPVSCASPRFDRWAGPPQGGRPPLPAARALDTVSREPIALTALVRTALPALGLPGAPPPRQSARPGDAP